MQRLFDIFFSGIALLILFPLLVIIIIILKFTGEGEIFYRQLRIGKNRKKFELLKFVTMLKNSEKFGAGTVTLQNDYRVLPFGKFLRKTKLNEIPQLINIFIGEMSVIGPRPLHKKQFSFYSENDQKLFPQSNQAFLELAQLFFETKNEFYIIVKIQQKLIN